MTKLSDYILQYATKEPKIEPNFNKITNKIYLGNRICAKDEKFFKKYNIKAVLNCTKEIPNYFANKGVEYARIPVDDELRESDFELMLKFMPFIAEFIHKHADIQKNNIYIHCYAGFQRSLCSLVAYLMKFKRMNPYEACRFSIKRRPGAFHYGTSLNFEKSIIKYHKNITKKC